MSIHAFAAQLAVERLEERIVRGLGRAGEVEDPTTLVSPRTYVPRDKLTAVVTINILRSPIFRQAVSSVAQLDHKLPVSGAIVVASVAGSLKAARQLEQITEACFCLDLLFSSPLET